MFKCDLMNGVIQLVYLSCYTFTDCQSCYTTKCQL